MGFVERKKSWVGRWKKGRWGYRWGYKVGLHLGVNWGYKTLSQMGGVRG